MTIEDSSGTNAGTITTDNTGRGIYVDDGNLTLKGGSISNNTVIGTETNQNKYMSGSGAGVYVNGGNFIMNGGIISNNTAATSINTAATSINTADADNNVYNDEANRGGGVFVAKSTNNKTGQFTMNGGIIRDNKAGEGGGIFLEYAPVGVWNPANQFFMNGGIVDRNTAYTGEGGGIYIRGTGTISKGEITNNVTFTTKDLGGGGIYVEKDGVLELTNAIITANEAQGLGGGFAACVHGITSMINVDGAAIYDNINHRNSKEEVGYVKSSAMNNASKGHKYTVSDTEWWYDLIDGHTLWAGDGTKDSEANEDFINAAKDVFSAGDATQGDATQGYAGAMFGSVMLGGGLENWSGYTANEEKNGKVELTGITSENNAVVASGRLLGLSADPTEDAITAALKAQGVLISGNISMFTHGGGIANNGTVTMGSKEIKNQFNSLPEFEVSKKLLNTENKDGNKGDLELTGDDFQFNLYTDKECTNQVSSDKNDKDGKATLNIPSSYFDPELKHYDGDPVKDSESGTTTYTYTFFVKEDGNADDPTITYDMRTYKITVDVVAEEKTFTVGNRTYTSTVFSSEEPVVTVDSGKTDGNGDVIWTPANEGISFENKYTKPVERSVSTPLEFSLEKVFRAVGGVTGNVSGKFNFEVSTEDGKVLSNEAVTVNLGETNSAKFSLDPEVLVKNGFVSGNKNFVFHVREVNDGQSNVTYSSAEYRVSVPVVVNTVMKTITQAIDGTIMDADKDDEDSFLANVTSYSFKENELKVTATNASAGESFDEDDNIFKFINTYKPDEPETPDIPLTPLVAYDPFDLTIQKIFEVVNGTAPTNATFTFDIAGDLTDSKTVTFGTANQGKNTATADLRVLANRFNEDGTLQDISFTVTEKNDGMENVTYSGYTYEVSLKCATKVVDGMTHYYYVPTITCSENGSAVDGVAADIANNILTFTNVFKPTTPPTDTDSEKPGPDPEEPTTPPTTPDRPSRPTPPPTPEEPTIDIPDDDVPLAPAPEEPEVSIPDEDVPLAGEPPLVELPEPEVPLAPMPPETTTIPDPEVPLAGVPQTGDNAGGFYALMALAACGLVVLNLRKKENEI